MRIKWENHAPVGLDGGNEARWILAGWIFAGISACVNFGNQYSDALSRLYNGWSKQLIPGAMMPEFMRLMEGFEVGFGLVCMIMPFLAVYHYQYHYRGAKAIYLMRRLPDKWELHRRCLTIPLVGIVASLGILGLLGIVFYLIYILCTPVQCLPV